MIRTSMIGIIAGEYFTEYENNETVTITEIEENQELDARIIGLSDGSCFFVDNNSTVRIARKINIGYIKYDEYRGYIYRNGKTVRELA